MATLANTIAEFEPLKLIVRPSMLEDTKKFTSKNVHVSKLISYDSSNFARPLMDDFEPTSIEDMDPC